MPHAGRVAGAGRASLASGSSRADLGLLRMLRAPQRSSVGCSGTATHVKGTPEVTGTSSSVKETCLDVPGSELKTARPSSWQSAVSFCSILRRVSFTSGDLEFATVCRSWERKSDECVARVCVSQGAQLQEASVSQQLARFHDLVSVDLRKRSLQTLGDELLTSKLSVSSAFALPLKRP